MNHNRDNALVYAYYLSKFDKAALKTLNFNTWKDAYFKGNKLWNIKETTIHNMRDEFDSIMDNKRVGWYQKPLSISRVIIHEQYKQLLFESFTLIIKKLLFDETSSYELNDIVDLNNIKSKGNNQKYYSVQRISTGIKAEEYFIDLFSKSKIGHSGELKDTRALGCGYDFKEITQSEIHYYEIKGRFEFSGGIHLTEKEWLLAQKYKEHFHIILISNISTPGKEVLESFTNPAKIFTPELYKHTVIQTSWNISEKDLR